MTSPIGVVFDVTDRMVGDAIGSITYSTEEELLVLTHGDVTFSLDNSDGAVEQFLRGAAPDDVYEVTVERTTGRRRCKWERIFGGILDLPWSIRFDHHDRTVEVQAFSFSKMLENASAEVVKRDFDGLIGSVSASSKVVTITDTTGMYPDDQIRLRDNTNDETQTIAKVLTGTTVQTRSAWTNTFSALTPLTVETPYPRDVSIQSLADDLFDAAGITSRTIEIINPLARFPISTPMNSTSYPRDVDTGDIVDPRSFTSRAGILDIRMTDDGVDKRAEAPDPADAWTVATTGALRTISDWTPYQNTEPATFPDNGSFLLDDGQQHASDHDANVLWDLREGGTKFDLYTLVVGGGGIGGSTNIATPFNTVTGNQCHAGIDVDPVSGDVWMSCTGKTGDAGDKDSVKVWNGAALVTIETAFSGQVRYLRRLGLVAIHEYDPGAANGHNPKTSMRLYDAATRALVRTIAVPQNLWAWSLRVWSTEEGIRIAGLYTLIDTTRLRIWSATWEQVADYEVAGAGSGVVGTNAFLSVFTERDGSEIVIGAAGNVLFVLDKGYRGVVPYADMSDKSVAAGLRELALISMAYIDVDAFKVGTLRGRGNVDNEASLQPVEVGTPLSRRSWQVWEAYRTSAKVSGRDSAGKSFEVVSGDTGASARRIELSGDLVTSGGLAEAIGTAYVSYLGVARTQEEVEVQENGRVILPLMYVLMDARTYRVIESSFSVDDRKQKLSMVEAA